MRNLSLAVVSLVLFAVAARADDAIPPEMVTAIKAATVFVKVETEGLSGSGSGFVIKTDGDSAYVVTNHHVVEPKAVQVVMVPDRRSGSPRRSRGSRRGGAPTPFSLPSPQISPPSYTPRLLVRSFKNASVTVVFQSGTKQEESMRGEVLAADPENDLAVIKVSGVKKVPKPIDYQHDPTLAETTPIYVFGFPLGEILSTSKGSPAITVGKGSISSLRMDDDGNLALVQIDAALNHGNSGGPVVDAQGRLVGVAVATIRDSTGIGLAIPSRELSQMLEGRLGKVYLHSSQDKEGRMTVHVEVGLIDPMNKIKSASLHYLAASWVKDKPKPTDPLVALPRCLKLPLKLEKQLASGEFTMKSGVTEVSLLYQAVYVNDAGKRGLTSSVTETIKAKTAEVAEMPAAAGGGSARARPPVRPGGGPAGPETRILGGVFDPQFKDAAPEKGLLIGFEVGLAKFVNRDVVHTIRPIFSSAQGEDVLGKQHGTDTSRLVRVKAKKGYAVAAITAKASLTVDGFSVTFMRIDKDRLNPDESYESDWVGGKGGGPETRLGGNGTPVIGIIGKENSKDCTGLGLLLATAETKETGSTAASPRNTTPHAGSSAGPSPDSQSGQPAEKPPAATSGESEFAPKNGMFTIIMPASLKSTQKTQVLTLHGHRVPIEGAQRILEHGTSFAVASIGIPAVVMREIPADQRFDVVRDALVKQFNGKVAEESDIQAESLPGKRYRFEGPRGLARVQMFMLGGWVWYADVEGKTDEELTSKEAEAFFSSFHLTEKGKLAASKVVHRP